MNRNETICPECEHRLNVGAHPFLGQKPRCPNCETGLVILNLRPLELDVAVPTNRSARQENKRSTSGKLHTFCGYSVVNKPC